MERQPGKNMIARAVAGFFRIFFPAGKKKKKRKGAIFEKAVGISYGVGGAEGKRKDEG